MAIIKGLFSGKIRTFEPGGERTGIYKDAQEAVTVSALGIDGDHQADKRYHGGVDKALHQFSENGYKTLLKYFPSLQNDLSPGSFGENLVSDDLNEANVFIGDIYRLNAVVLQVSEPRRPCWKINRKFSTENLSVFVEQQGITGWYYRVLEPGTIRTGETFSLEERINENASIARFTQIANEHRPTLDDLREILSLRGLSANWKKRLEKRLEFLACLKK